MVVADRFVAGSEGSVCVVMFVYIVGMVCIASDLRCNCGCWIFFVTPSQEINILPFKSFVGCLGFWL